MVKGITVESMAGRQICCCGARSWTKIIAYVQIAIHGIASLIVAITLIAIAVGGRSLFTKVTQSVKDDSDEENDDDHVKPIELLGYIGYLVFLAVLLLIFIIGVVTGVLLLKGVYKENTSYLKIWTVFAGVCAILSVLSVLISPSVDDILSVLFTVGLYGFGIWVVRILIFEINTEEAKRQERRLNSDRQLEYNPYYYQQQHI